MWLAIEAAPAQMVISSVCPDVHSGQASLLALAPVSPLAWATEQAMG